MLLVAAHWGRLSRPCPYYFIAVLLLVFYSFPSASVFKSIIVLSAKNDIGLRRAPRPGFPKNRNLAKAVALPFDG